MSDPPNPYRLLAQRAPGVPPSIPVLPLTSVQEQTTRATIDTPAGNVTMQTTRNRITTDNTTGDRVVETTMSRTPSLDGRVVDEKNAVVCPWCEGAPYAPQDVIDCAGCGKPSCKRRCLTLKDGKWRHRKCHLLALFWERVKWLTTR